MGFIFMFVKGFGAEPGCVLDGGNTGLAVRLGR